MQTTPESLRRRFADKPFLQFDTTGGLTRVGVQTPACTASILLQGAHLTGWQPAGEQPVIFLSRKSEFAPGKPVRGGIPIAFPWFSADKKQDRIDGHPGPSHGFARIEEWTLASAELRGGDADLLFTLGPTDLSRSMGFDAFGLALRFTLGRTLRAELTVHNTSAAPLEYEQAFHTYFQVGDIHEVTIRGLEDARFIDKIDGFQLKQPEGKPITFTGALDRLYLDTTSPLSLGDGANHRTIHMRKEGSRSSVVWNPFRPLPDLGEWDWHDMVAMETANADVDRVTLAPGRSAVMAMAVTVERDRR